MIQLISGFNAFHSAISKTIVDIQEVNSPHSIDEISIPTTMSTLKMSLEAIGSKRFKDGGVKIIRLLKKSRNTFFVKEHLNV